MPAGRAAPAEKLALPTSPSKLSLCPVAPPSSLVMVDCPRLWFQRKPQVACGGGSCCLQHKSPTAQESDSWTQSHLLPEGETERCTNNVGNLLHTLSTVRGSLEAVEAMTTQESRENKREKRQFPQSRDRAELGLQQGGDDACYSDGATPGLWFHLQQPPRSSLAGFEQYAGLLAGFVSVHLFLSSLP